jgi:Ribonuclease G/E
MRDFVVTEITFDDKQYLTAVLSEDQTITELQAMPAGDSSPVGEVVLAVVETVSKNTGGAFLMAGRHGRVFLPVRDFTKIRESTPILVQIIKEAAGRKVPVAAGDDTADRQIRRCFLCSRTHCLFTEAFKGAEGAAEKMDTA